jgi:DNA-3-methyladenine glycosylase II
MARIGETYGYPDPFSWPAGSVAGASNFAALVLHITSQQISTRVALTVFARLQDVVGTSIDPLRLAGASVDDLRTVGLSAAKAHSITELARLQVAGDLDVDALGDLDDTEVIATLTAARGIGRWTAEMFLIHQLRRPDVLPAGDLGIRRAVQRLYAQEALPEIDTVRDLGVRWMPYRTYAAGLLWRSLRDP